jgi:hypothetical protein
VILDVMAYLDYRQSQALGLALGLALYLALNLALIFYFQSFEPLTFLNCLTHDITVDIFNP